MKSHWCVHMKNGDLLCFNCQSGYIHTENGLVYFMDTEFVRNIFAVIPIENILWIESVENKEE